MQCTIFIEWFLVFRTSRRSSHSRPHDNYNSFPLNLGRWNVASWRQGLFAVGLSPYVYVLVSVLCGEGNILFFVITRPSQVTVRSSGGESNRFAIKNQHRSVLLCNNYRVATVFSPNRRVEIVTDLISETNLIKNIRSNNYNNVIIVRQFLVTTDAHRWTSQQA